MIKCDTFTVKVDELGELKQIKIGYDDYLTGKFYYLYF